MEAPWSLRLDSERNIKSGSVYSLGWELQYNYTAFKLNQDSLKKVPNSFQNKKNESISRPFDWDFLIGSTSTRSEETQWENTLIYAFTGEWNYGRQNVTKNDLPMAAWIYIRYS